MKQRYFMCFLLSGAMLIYGIEYLSLDGSGIDQIFAWLWIAFAVFVISGNGLHLLYQKNVGNHGSVSIEKRDKTKTKLRG